MTIYAMHGVVEGYDRDLFSHRNLMDTEVFRRHLASVRQYVSVKIALKEGGDALTIDDATVAGARAARMALNAGHTVTLFANPDNITRTRPLFFQTLNYVLDFASIDKVTHLESELIVGRFTSKAALRKAIKQHYVTSNDEEACSHLVNEIARKLEVETGVAPEGVSLSVQDVLHLSHLGVDIENHGWAHLNPAARSPEDLSADVERAFQWICDITSKESQYFAAPFGSALPPQNFRSRALCWFTLHSRFTEGFLDKAVYNRVDLVDALLR